MARTAERASTPAPGGATLDFERQLWTMADGLRGHMDAAEYKHVVLGLIFLKYISDAFAERYEQLQNEAETGADPEDRDEYTAEGTFWVPPDARWDTVKTSARLPTIGAIVDDAMDAIERENPTLKDVLPKKLRPPHPRPRPPRPQSDMGSALVPFVGAAAGLALGLEAHRLREPHCEHLPEHDIEVMFGREEMRTLPLEVPAHNDQPWTSVPPRL